MASNNPVPVAQFLATFLDTRHKKSEEVTGEEVVS